MLATYFMVANIYALEPINSREVSKGNTYKVYYLDYTGEVVYTQEQNYGTVPDTSVYVPEDVELLTFNKWFYDKELTRPFDPELVLYNDTILYPLYSNSFVTNLDVGKKVLNIVPSKLNSKTRAEVLTGLYYGYDIWLYAPSLASKTISSTTVNQTFTHSTGTATHDFIYNSSVTFDLAGYARIPASANFALSSGTYYYDANLTTVNSIWVTYSGTKYYIGEQTSGTYSGNTIICWGIPSIPTTAVTLHYILDGVEAANYTANYPQLVTLGWMAVEEPGYSEPSYWYTDASLTTSSTSYYLNLKQTTADLYFKLTPNTYTITYDATTNGGTVGTTTGTATFNRAYPAQPTPTKAGSTFLGWYTSATGGTKVTTSTTYTTVGNVKLYAQFSTNSYTVTYNNNGGTVGKASDTVVYNSTVTLPTATKTGYNCTGWYTASSGGTKVGNVGASYTVTNNITIYPQWSVNQYTLQLESNGGTTYSDIVQNYGTTYTLPTPTKVGSTFGGWYKDVGLTVSAGSSFTFDVTSTTKLYAKFTSNSYTVNYSTDKGTISKLTDTAMYGVKVKLPTGFGDGIELEGWYSEPALTTKVGNPNADYTVIANITLYPKWVNKSYNISGTIINQWDKPISGVTITYNNVSTVSDTNGYFTLSAPSKYSDIPLSFDKLDYSHYEINTQLTENIILSQLVVLNKYYFTVSGYARDATNEIIKDASITVDGHKTTTDSTGYYYLEVPIN